MVAPIPVDLIGSLTALTLTLGGMYALGQTPYTDDTYLNEAVQKWVSTSQKLPLAHWGVTLGTNLTSYVLGQMGKLPVWNPIPQSALSITQEVYKSTAAPNVAGIPVYANMQKKRAEADVSTTPVIQQSISARTYVTDSSTPKPKEFTLEGYIMPLVLSVDAGLSIKPTIVMQLKYIDAVIASRRPVWYKDAFSRFFLVMVTACEEEHDPKVQNGVKVSINMQEYVPYVVSKDTTTLLAGSSASLAMTEPIAKA